MGTFGQDPMSHILYHQMGFDWNGLYRRRDFDGNGARERNARETDCILQVFGLFETVSTIHLLFVGNAIGNSRGENDSFRLPIANGFWPEHAWAAHPRHFGPCCLFGSHIFY